MSSSTPNLDLISSSQAQKEVAANELFLAGSPSTAFSRRRATSTGLTWGYYGTQYRKLDGSFVNIPNGTLTLVNSATNYVEVDKATGSVTVNQTGFAASGTLPLYSIVVAGGTPTSWIDYRQIVGEGTQGPPGADGAPGANGAGSLDGIFGCTFDAGTGLLTNGAFGDVYVPYDCDIDEWVVTCFPTGSITIQVWAADIASYPPTSGDTITGGNDPAVVNDEIAQGDSTGWSASLAAGTMIRFTLASNVGIQRATVTLKITKTASP